MLLKNKDAETTRNFILNLPFYGGDVNLTRKYPNGSDFRVGYGFEPNIKISVAAHIERIDKIFENKTKNTDKLKKMFARKRSSLIKNNLFNINKDEDKKVNNENKTDEANKTNEEKKMDENWNMMYCLV